MFNLLTNLADARETPGKGHGSFAVQPIPAGTFVVCFGGTPLSFDDFASHNADRRSRSIQVDHDLVILGPPEREPGDSINHSCDPNLGLVAANRLIARRDIAVGEELTYDYATSDSVPYDEFVCACASPNCRGTVRGIDWARSPIQTANTGWFSPYLARRIAGLRLARPLAKRDVEHMLATFDDDPEGSILRALRITTGLHHASWSTARAILKTVGVIVPPESPESDASRFDDALRWFNETRGVSLSDPS
ncbi:MAG: SET domain-containing protein [Actinobacteria bacterium]|nr:SET domain-containing protein [Actinomycetota bacterium]